MSSGTPKTQLKSIKSADMLSILENAANRQSVKLAKGINWPKVWDAARDRGQFLAGIVQTFYRLLTTTVFGDRLCWKCDSIIPPHVSFIEHFSHSHVTGPASLNSVVSDLSLNL
jgi:hypothetical protein